MITKVKLDPKAAMRRQTESSIAAADDRFAIAQAVTQRRPTGLTAEEGAPVALTTPSEQVGKRVVTVARSGGFDIASCEVNSIVEVPLAYIEPNALSPRQIYLDENVDLIAESLPTRQDVPVSGYVKDGRIHLIDGGTRLRAARISDREFLDVKIEEAPENDLALFKRARDFNEHRSATTPLDFALSLKLLLERKAVGSQDEIVELIEGPDKKKLTKATVSKYLRIARMPDKVQRAMSQSEETTSLAALYAVSELFSEGQDDAELERATEAALEIVDEVRRRKLNRNQITTLVKHRLEGPKTRDRSATLPLDFGRRKGQVKMFYKKGQIDLTINGLVEDEMPELRSMLVKAVEEYMEQKKGTE